MATSIFDGPNATDRDNDNERGCRKRSERGLGEMSARGPSVTPLADPLLPGENPDDPYARRANVNGDFLELLASKPAPKLCPPDDDDIAF